MSELAKFKIPLHTSGIILEVAGTNVRALKGYTTVNIIVFLSYPVDGAISISFCLSIHLSQTWGFHIVTHQKFCCKIAKKDDNKNPGRKNAKNTSELSDAKFKSCTFVRSAH